MVSIAGLNQDAALLQERIERFHAVREGILTQVREVIVGQEEVLDQILIAIFVGGHCLLTGMPGTAKTLMVRTIAEALGLQFRRIQFTPDLMPSDITGTDIIEEDLTTGHRKWTFVEGPIFGNILLADEINRTPPKTQSALLEAMQEHSCTVRGHIYRLPAPFFVLATQNPIELEGTYPLPEAQLDRFLFNSILGDLSAEDELKVIDRTTATRVTDVKAVTSAEDLLDFQQLVRMVPIAETLARYVISLVRATRPKSESAPDLSRNMSTTAPAFAPRNSSCSPPRRARSRTSAITSPTTTSPRSSCPCCAIAFCSTSMPSPIASTPTKSSAGSIAQVPRPKES